MVLGKAEDGGYYLIGLHKSTKSVLGRLLALYKKTCPRGSHSG